METDTHDSFGNVKTAHLAAERVLAGVLPHHSHATASQITDDYLAAERQRSANMPDINVVHLLGFLVVIIVGFILVFSIRYTYDRFPAWKAERENNARWESVQSRKSRRAALFSDYSVPSEWPQALQAAYQRNAAEPLPTILQRHKKQAYDRMSPSTQRALGAQVWLRIAHQKSAAESYLLGQRYPNNEGTALHALSYSIQFLRQQCREGVEVACLDIAKAYASELFFGIAGDGDAAITMAALKELPSKGPLGRTPAINALRERLIKAQDG